MNSLKSYFEQFWCQKTASAQLNCGKKSVDPKDAIEAQNSYFLAKMNLAKLGARVCGKKNATFVQIAHYL
jgi:hypothetical protein